MIYDMSHLGVWIVLTLAVGVVVGWRTRATGPHKPWFDEWFKKSVIAFAVALLVAFLQWLPGRAGLWLEMAVIFYATYIAGCVLGVFFGNLVPETNSEGAFVAIAPAPSPRPTVAAKIAPVVESQPASAAAPAPAPQAVVAAKVAPVVKSEPSPAAVAPAAPAMATPAPEKPPVEASRAPAAAAPASGPAANGSGASASKSEGKRPPASVDARGRGPKGPEGPKGKPRR